MDVFAQPLAQAGELAGGDLVVEVREVDVRPLPQLPGDQVAERVGREVADQPADQCTSWSTPWASSGTSSPR